MLIECPSCTRSYHVARAALEPGGREVICTHCDIRWFVAGDASAQAPAPLAAAPEIRAEAHSERSRPARYEELYGATSRTTLPPRAGSRMPRLAPALAVLALLIGPSAIIAARVPLVRHIPQFERFFAAIQLPANVRGLSLADLATRRDASGAETFLDVRGEIANVRAGNTPLPALRLTIMDGDGQPIYGWTEPAPKAHLAAGEHVTFHARLAAPPPGGAKVVVRFASAAEVATRR